MPNLSNLSWNTLLRAVYRTVNDILKLSYDDLSGLRNVGVGTIDNIISSVRNYELDWLSFKTPEAVLRMLT